MVGASTFPPVAGLVLSFQRMLPSYICGFITEDVTNNAGFSNHGGISWDRTNDLYDVNVAL